MACDVEDRLRKYARDFRELARIAQHHGLINVAKEHASYAKIFDWVAEGHDPGDYVRRLLVEQLEVIRGGKDG